MGADSLVEDFNYALGQRLRAARRQRGWSLGDVEGHTGGEFKASVVGAYERGERAISVQRFVSLAEIYGSAAGDLLPAESQGEFVIDLDALAADDGDLVFCQPGGATVAPAGVDTVVVGPEGGFAEDELPDDARVWDLGPTVLRVETAAIVAAISIRGN